MELDEFVAKFAEQFDETDASEITPTTLFHSLEEWSSILGMCVIAMAKTEYGKNVTGAEIRQCKTVEDLFVLVRDK